MAGSAVTERKVRREIPRPAFINREIALRLAVNARKRYEQSLEELIDSMPEHVTMMDVLNEVRAGANHSAVVESRVLAERAAAGASDRSLEKLATDTGLSKRDAKRAIRRAKAVAGNGGLAESGLTAGQLDVIADAAARTDGAAATDQGLIDAVAQESPDQGRRLAGAWERQRQEAHAVQTEHDRQHRRRRVTRWIADDGAHVLAASGSRTHIDKLWQHIQSTANQLYRSDGGRGVSARKHPRTRSQRLFDAFEQVMFLAGDDSLSRLPGRPVTVITVGIDRIIDGTGPAAQYLGSGPLPDTMLAEIMGRSDLVGAVFGRDGEVLWQGRKYRHATTAQQLALTIRDRGCVLCGTDPARCEAHHILPWEAPGKGTTDLTNLALVCPDDHHQLHQLELTLVGQGASTWSTRPATRSEIAPTRPQRE